MKKAIMNKLDKNSANQSMTAPKQKKSKKKNPNTHPFNHDIFYDRDSWFIAYFVQIPRSARDKLIISKSHVINTSNNEVFHLLPEQRDLDLTGRKSGFHVNQESLLGKNIGTLFFWGLDKHLWRKHCIFSLLLSRVLELGAHSTTSCKTKDRRSK